MKQTVQILLIALCLFPLCSSAEEETMEERKRRITRKYLRERTNVTQSDSMVPVDRPNEEQIADSKRFQEPKVAFERQEPGMQMQQQSPPQQTIPRPAVNRNWLLADDSEESDLNAEDPYANPFSSKSSESKKATQQDWTSWSKERESAAYEKSQGDSWSQSRMPGSTFKKRSSEYEPNQPTGLYSGKESMFSNDGTLPGYQQQERSSIVPRTNWDATRNKALNPEVEQSYLQSPFQSRKDSSVGLFSGSDSSSAEKRYTPYKSPFEVRREERKQQWGTVIKPEETYQKPSTYQSWKDKNKTRLDPTRDDFFIDELMPKTRR
jgi:hypothetical protein